MTTKPDLTRTWAASAPGGNVVDPDVTTPGKFATGWVAEVPPFEHFNFLQKTMTQGLAHNNEQGVNVWDTDTTYPVGGIAKGSDGVLYECVTSQSGNDPISDNGGNWVPFKIKDTNQIIIDGDFDIWTEGTTVSTPGDAEYVCSLWNTGYNGTDGSYNVVRQTHPLGQTDVIGNPKYFLRWDQFVAGVGDTFRDLSQQVEGVETLSGKYITIDFFAKASTSEDLIVKTEQYFGAGGSPSASVFNTSSTLNISTSWQRFKVTFFLQPVTGKTLGTSGDDSLNIIFSLPPSELFTMDFSHIRVWEGKKAFDSERERPTDTVNKLSRYYQKSYDFGVAPGFATFNSSGVYTATFVGAANNQNSVHLGNGMRKLPEVRIFSPNDGAEGFVYDGNGTANIAATVENAGQKNFSFFTDTPSGVGARLRYHWVADARF